MAASAVPFDPLDIARRLTDAGMEAGPAEAVAQVLADERAQARAALNDHLATKADIAAINERMAAGDRRIEERIAELGASHQSELAAINASHQSELAAIRERIARIEERMAASDRLHEERMAASDRRHEERMAEMDKRNAERFAEMDKRNADRLDARLSAMQLHLVKWIVGVGLGVLSAGFALWRLLGAPA